LICKNLNKNKQNLLELARRFALTFGLDTVRTRDAVANLHRGGIDFAMEMHEAEDRPRYLSFLEVLTEFSTKLIKQDRSVLLRYLEGRLPEGRKQVCL
jgi:cohesin complex subunit SA-1/2